jgi:hypothetical protein
MESKDLVGEHILDGVDFSTLRLPKAWEDSNCIRFRLDGVVYVAIEDPDDGYRSSMEELKIDESTSMENTFPPIKVLGRMLSDCDKEILELIDVITGECIVEVGTKNIDDYYPCFVCNYNPEGMVTNR